MASQSSPVVEFDTSPEKAPGTYQAPVFLETMFMRGPNGATYELSLQDAERYLVTPERSLELGHAPFPPEEDEVVGHHKVPSSSAADPSGWSYHTTWMYGAYFDQLSGRFAVGMHRHPYADERAIAALDGDFS